MWISKLAFPALSLLRRNPVTVALVVSLLGNGVAGFYIARQTRAHAEELAQVQVDIAEQYTAQYQAALYEREKRFQEREAELRAQLEETAELIQDAADRAARTEQQANEYRDRLRREAESDEELGEWADTPVPGSTVDRLLHTKDSDQN